MISRTELVIDVLVGLVEAVAERPRRVLFRGASNYSDSFAERVQRIGADWDVRVTGAGDDLVGARNDPAIGTLVVFYRGDVRERESLNAFRQFDEGELVRGLLKYAASGRLAESYSDDDLDRLHMLLDLAYPSADRLADFLLHGKAAVGEALPGLGLFNDPDLTHGLELRMWRAKIVENHASAVLRWRDFVEKAQRKKDAQRLLGKDRLALIHLCETEPAAKQAVLEQVTLAETLSILNPPNRLVEALMQAGLLREEAEVLIANVKAGLVDPNSLPGDMPTLAKSVLQRLRQLAPAEETAGDDEIDPEPENRRVGFCLEALLHLARQSKPLPPRLHVMRDENDNGPGAELWLSPEGHWQVTLDPEAARALSVPAEGASELLFRITDASRENVLLHFSIENVASRLRPYAEIWPGAADWEAAVDLDANYAPEWTALRQASDALRDIVDPDWHNEPAPGDTDPEREPNNSIYMVFDLVYLANQKCFEDFLDAWLNVAVLPWQAQVASRPAEWQGAIASLLKLGLAERPDDGVAVMPFHPLRLLWYRAVFAWIQDSLAHCVLAGRPLVFEPVVLAEQLQPVDRPRALIHDGQRLLEAQTASFCGLYVPDARQRRTRAPLARAHQKLEQFGRMWPFSLNRLHLAFQPGEAAQDIYQLVAQQAEDNPDAAFRIRAIVDTQAAGTAFDGYLLTTTDATTDLKTQEHHESLLPRVEYAKGRLDESSGQVMAHIAILADAFREEGFDYHKLVGRLNQPDWRQFDELVADLTPEHRQQLKNVDLTAPSWHTGQGAQLGQRNLVYVPMVNGAPEYSRLLFDSLNAWMKFGHLEEGVYFERVRWDTQALADLHDQADWVILFDRAVDKRLFEEQLAPANVRLIDFYDNLPGGYRFSVSSKRTEAVKWQLVQVLRQYFRLDLDDPNRIADEMLQTLSRFAGGLLLKTLGGGSLAQELLGLYATYLSLLSSGEYDLARDRLIPLDSHQDWFGRRNQKGRRADLLVLRHRTPRSLEMLAVESKWYKSPVSTGFVKEEFGEDGQLRTAVNSLHALFTPDQDRLDHHYWQRTLRALVDPATGNWASLHQAFEQGNWELKVDGMVYVHQYAETNRNNLGEQEVKLQAEASRLVQSQDATSFAFGPAFERLKLKSYPELVELFQLGPNR